MIFIPEGDVYRLITKSRLKSAQNFEKWVFDEVLPAIRKTGGYLETDLLDRVKDNPELLLNLPRDFWQKTIEIENCKIV